MAVIDFVWIPNTSQGTPAWVHGGTAQYMSITEGTYTDRSIPLQFTISAPSAQDVVIEFALYGNVRYATILKNNYNGFFPDSPAFGLFAQGEDIQYAYAGVSRQFEDGSFRMVLPAGQTSVSFNLPINADNQPENEEYFNLYISSVTGGHTIHSSDLRANQEYQNSIFDTPRLYSNFGYNTFAIIDDDGPSGNVFTALVDSFVIPENFSAPVFMGSGNDNVTGSSGADVVMAHDGDDTVVALGGNDAVNAGEGRDRVYGGDGNDYIFGRGGDDLLYGEADDDLIQGGAYWDTIHGGDGNDLLDGGNGADQDDYSPDIIFGGAGSDAITGRQGSDFIMGGLGVDFLSGGGNQDLFVFTGVGDQGDIVVDFNAAALGSLEQDALDFRSYFDSVGYAGSTARQDGWLWAFQNETATDIYVAQVGGDFSTAFRMVTLQNLVAAGLTDSYMLT